MSRLTKGGAGGNEGEEVEVISRRVHRPCPKGAVPVSVLVVRGGKEARFRVTGGKTSMMRGEKGQINGKKSTLYISTGG